METSVMKGLGGNDKGINTQGFIFPVILTKGVLLYVSWVRKSVKSTTLS